MQRRHLPICVILCLARTVFDIKDLSHLSHLNDFGRSSLPEEVVVIDAMSVVRKKMEKKKMIAVGLRKYRTVIC